MSNDNSFEFKVVMIGDVSVGKTAIANWLQFQVFEEDYQPTVGAGYIPYKTKYKGKDVELQIWDTAGMEKYRSLGAIYYRDSNAAIIVFDQTSKESADAIGKWLDNFRQTISTPCPIFIAANKNDLPDKQVDLNKIKEMCEQQKFSFYITSAKTGTGIEKMFKDLIERIASENDLSNQGSRQLRKIEKKKGCC
jgi:small GTP-binding protein